MEKRLYEVQVGEHAVDYSEIGTIEQAVAKFIIKPDKHAINDQWNGINQGDLEGYVLTKENGEHIIYKIYGFDKDSKVYLDYPYFLKEENRLKSALISYCDAFDVKTNRPLNVNEVEELLKGA